MSVDKASGGYTLKSAALQKYPRNQWYVAAFSHEVGKTLLTRQLLDDHVVFYRTEDGRAVALHDQCPHRGLPLSDGKLIGDRLQCGYHGMEFGADGKCKKIPSQKAISPQMYVRSYPLFECWQWIWIWMGDQKLADLSLLPDQDWIGVTSPGLIATPFFHVEINANYQFMHDNLLDTSHVSYLHSGLLDAGDLGEAPFWVEEEGFNFRMGRETPNTVMTGPVAEYYRIKENHPYDRRLVVETRLPSINVGKNVITDPANPQDPPKVLHVINAMTPANPRKTHVFHAQITSYEPNWRPEEIEGVRYVVTQDKVAFEAIQSRFEENNDALVEVSVRADEAGVLARRKLSEMVSQEKLASLDPVAPPEPERALG